MTGAYYCLFTARTLADCGIGSASAGPVLYGAEAFLLCVQLPVPEMLLLIGGLIVINRVTAWFNF